MGERVLKVYVVLKSAMFTKYFSSSEVVEVFQTEKQAEELVKKKNKEENDRCKSVGSNAGAMAYYVREGRFNITEDSSEEGEANL